MSVGRARIFRVLPVVDAPPGFSGLAVRFHTDWPVTDVSRTSCAGQLSRVARGNTGLGCSPMPGVTTLHSRRLQRHPFVAPERLRSCALLSPLGHRQQWFHLYAPLRLAMHADDPPQVLSRPRARDRPSTAPAKSAAPRMSLSKVLRRVHDARVQSEQGPVSPVAKPKQTRGSRTSSAGVTRTTSRSTISRSRHSLS